MDLVNKREVNQMLQIEHLPMVVKLTKINNNYYGCHNFNGKSFIVSPWWEQIWTKS